LFVVARHSAGATYRGIAYALGLTSRSGVRAAVLCALEHELVQVIPTGRGPGALTVVRISERGRALISLVDGK
jgi:hypothetical protein